MSKIFLDSSDVDLMRHWRSVISGVTTNPSILKKEDGDLEAVCRYMVNKHVSVESGEDLLQQAEQLWNWLSPINSAVTIKIPFLDSDGRHNLNVITTLTEKGIPVNCTAMLSLSQIILASKAGAKYVSLFAGRIDDEGGDYKEVIKDCVAYLDNNFFDKGCELIVGSVRTVGNVLDSIRAGAHIVTITPPVLQKMVTHQYSILTSKQFEEDYNTVAELRREKVSINGH
jgi:transaldolase